MSARYGRRVLAAIAALGLLYLLTGVALAKGELLEGKLRTGDTITIGVGETVDHDLYLFGGTVTVNGTVNGDVVASGGQVNIGGSVIGDLVAAGGNVTVSGVVQGDARLAGGQISLSGQVTEDAVLGAGQASVGGQVGGDLIFSAGQVNVPGTIGGSIAGSAGEYALTGSVGGTEEVAVGGDEEPAPATFAEQVADAIRHFAVVVLVGALGLWLVPRGMRAAEATVRTNPLLALANGVLGIVSYVVLVILALVAMVLLAILLGSLGFGGLVAIDIIAVLFGIGLISVAFVVAIAYLADAIVGLALARWVAPDFAIDAWRERALLAGGALVVVVLTSLPYVGGWLKLVVVLFGLGAIGYAAWRSWRARAVTTAPRVPPATA